MVRKCPKCGGTVWRLGNKEKPFYCNWCKEKFTEDEVLVKSIQSQKPRTNGDRLRALTDEELAKMINGFESFALNCGGAWPVENWLEWLKQETVE